MDSCGGIKCDHKFEKMVSTAVLRDAKQLRLENTDFFKKKLYLLRQNKGYMETIKLLRPNDL
jgi:hypothetical protein